MVSSTAVIYSLSSAGYPGASLHRSCGGFLREGSTKERRDFSLFPLHCSRGFTGFASRFPLPSGATRKRARRGRVGCRTLTLAILWLRQEPITRRKQLSCNGVRPILLVELEFWIPNVSRISSCIPDSMSKIFPHSAFHKQKFPGFRILDSNSDFLHWTTETLATQANHIYFCMNYAPARHWLALLDFCD